MGRKTSGEGPALLWNRKKEFDHATPHFPSDLRRPRGHRESADSFVGRRREPLPLSPHPRRDRRVRPGSVLHEGHFTGLIKIYDRLGQKRQGKVGVKVCFETPNGPHLDPKLVHAFADHVNGKLLDCTYYPPRDTVEKHLEVAKGNGFDTSRIDIIDAEGTVDLPIEGGKHLKFSRIGSHYNDYDTMIGLCRFKSHHIEFYGGMLKNLSIAIAPMEGKWLIHSAGKTDSGFSPSDNHIETQAMADYVKGVMDAKKGRWVFLTVLDAVAPTDGCEGAKNLGNIGILASTDPVAIDQAAIDITFGAAATPELRREWEEHHGTYLTSDAEAVGAGKTHYRFTPID